MSATWLPNGALHRTRRRACDPATGGKDGAFGDGRHGARLMPHGLGRFDLSKRRDVPRNQLVAAIILAFGCSGSHATSVPPAKGEPATPAPLRPNDVAAWKQSCSALPEAATGWPKKLRAFRIACTLGETSSCVDLGWSLLENRDGIEDVASAAKLFECACFRYAADGCDGLGSLYENGRGRRVDYARAGGLYQFACDAGCANACKNLGVLFERGLGRPPDPEKAFLLYQRACEARNVEACAALGYLFERGVGTSADPAAARKLYASACSGGSPTACNNLGVFFLRDGDGGYARAHELFRKACDGVTYVYPLGCYNLADMYKKRRAEPPSPDAIPRVLKKGCDSRVTVGRTLPCLDLATMALQGETHLISLADARALATRECQADVADGCMTLAWYFASQEQSIAKARPFLERACRLGSEQACSALKTLERQP